MKRYMVLIESSGNQRYIFATDKRRENVGSSDLIERVGRVWGHDAIERAEAHGYDVKTLIVAAGKILLHIDDRGAARDIVRDVTLAALREAPGLDVAGVIREFDADAPNGISNSSRAVHREFQDARARRPGPEHRFLQLPLVERCSSSGMPAARIVPVGGGPQPRSAASAAKLEAVLGGAYRRLAASIGVDEEALATRIVPWLASTQVDNDYDDAEDDAPPQDDGDREHVETDGDAVERAAWVAVVHADGNSLGEIFRTLDQPRDFSDAVDRCTHWAFERAVRETWGNPDNRMILPLVLGGDDLTVLCDGERALDFAISYLRWFEGFASDAHEASEDAAARLCIQEVVKKHTNGTSQRITASAGIAIVKPHFPFASAHDLASGLTKSAKSAKHYLGIPASSLDFHILYDSSISELDAIRKRLHTGETLLTAKPYVVHSAALITTLNEEQRLWADRHDVEQLRRRVNLIETGRLATGQAALPSAQVQQLREAMFRGVADASERFSILKARHGVSGVADLGDSHAADDRHPLYWEEPTIEAVTAGTSQSIRRTGALDAIDAVEFLSSDSASSSAAMAFEAAP
ncbi:MAG: hypothetical protein ABS52_07810 [Gemmatimonadetes bacterium SCN 70-22]|nr:MAG: hypothetical protein ABS52_07810 [Gemmatimonadetes bacterium SCN 70-22]